jgi:malate dehydrogenase (oxaloacetate-decarboxylating)(NADP+)
MKSLFEEEARQYHAVEPRGKLAVIPTKPMMTQKELSLAYSPGVAVPCNEIASNPGKVFDYTMRGNLVAVVTNGTAVLGLGNIGPLASKPVMEGKAALFKQFAGIDAFDLELDACDVDTFCNAVAPLEPTFGGINLEDLKAPECFEIERNLRARMNIPVFHDDQHGTAIVAAAAVLNAMEIVGKDLSEIRIAANGAGAASIACLELLISFGAQRSNITVCDRSGVIYEGRPGPLMDKTKLRFAGDTKARTLADAVKGADLFLGLSVAGALSEDMVRSMAPDPVVLAMANPEPEIRPEVAKAARSDVLIATGRSDYPNQVNNLLCFPFIFRGALDVGATEINEDMKMACAREIAALARQGVSDLVLKAYGVDSFSFGPDYLIPKPFDPRLIFEIAPAVAKAAMTSGVATRPIPDLEAYRQYLDRYVHEPCMIERPIVEEFAIA